MASLFRENRDLTRTHLNYYMKSTWWFEYFPMPLLSFLVTLPPFTKQVKFYWPDGSFTLHWLFSTNMCAMRAPERANALISPSTSAKQNKVKYLPWPSNWQCISQAQGKPPVCLLKWTSKLNKRGVLSFNSLIILFIKVHFRIFCQIEVCVI